MTIIKMEKKQRSLKKILLGHINQFSSFDATLEVTKYMVNKEDEKIPIMKFVFLSSLTELLTKSRKEFEN